MLLFLALQLCYQANGRGVWNNFIKTGRSCFWNIYADKGTKKSEIELAKLLVNKGVEEYLQKIKKELEKR